MERIIVARVAGLPIDQMGMRYYPCYGTYREGFGICVRCDCKKDCMDVSPISDLPELREKEYLDLIKTLVTFKKKNACMGQYGACEGCLLCSEQIHCKKESIANELSNKQKGLEKKMEEPVKLADMYALQKITDDNFAIICEQLEECKALIEVQTALVTALATALGYEIEGDDEYNQDEH